MKVLLVGSTGGHFKALQEFESFAAKHDSCWVTFPSSTTQKALLNQKNYWAYGPTNRDIPNLVKNFLLAFKVIIQEKPELILSTGAGVAVPFLILGKLLGAKTIFIESFTRVKELSLSARLVMPFLDVVYVQWQQLKDKYYKAKLLTSNAV